MIHFAMPMHQNINFTIRILLLLGLFNTLIYQSCIAQDPVFWQITDEDGLPGMTVYEITQDDLGFIWIGTADGLVRFDGREFIPFYYVGQKDNEIVTVRKDCNGRIWFSNLSNQVFFIESGQTITFLENSVEKSMRITSYDVGKDGLVFNCVDDAVLNQLEHSIPVILPALCRAKSISINKDRTNKGCKCEKNTLF